MINRELAASNYIKIPRFIAPERALELGAKFRDEALQKGDYADPQAPNSPSMYNHFDFIRMLVEKIPHVSEILGEPVLPTYTYSRVYVNGAELVRHIDREACEISLTLNLDKDSDWPIWFRTPKGTETFIELEPGDAAIYLGCVSEHWRQPFKGNEYIQVFLHYVRAYGRNSWAFFDQKR